MPKPIPHRNVTPLLDFFRTILRGRKFEVNYLRFADQVAARTQPQPNLPGGPYDRTTKISYYSRDARREMPAPTVVLDATQTIGKKSELKYLTPGKVYQPR